MFAFTEISEKLKNLIERQHELTLGSTAIEHLIRKNEIGRAKETACFLHEIKKPLAVIRGLIYRCNAQTSPELITETGKEIDVEISRAVKLLDDMTMITHLEVKPKDTQKISFSKICESAFAQQQANFPSHRFCKKIEKKVEIRSSAEEALMIAKNLLENAGKHTPANSKINFSLKKSSSEIILKVEDNGKGFSKTDQKHIFTPFYKSGKNAGNGLGLTMAKYAVERLRGTIEIYSKKGVGSKFIVKIPIRTNF